MLINASFLQVNAFKLEKHLGQRSLSLIITKGDTAIWTV